MKTAAWIALLAALFAAASPVAAQPGGGRHGMGPGGGRFFAERQQLRQQLSERQDVRQAAERDGLRGERCDGPCRMSPEERQQLRRDINDAGRDLYRRGPRRDD